MTKTEYAQYLQSAHWRDLREQAISNGSRRCAQCLLPRWVAELAYDQDLHVHHLTYERLGNERPEDLRVVCARCHEIATFGHSRLRVVRAFPCKLCGCIYWNRRYEYCDTCVDVRDSTYVFGLCGKPDPKKPGATMGEFFEEQVALARTEKSRLGRDVGENDHPDVVPLAPLMEDLEIPF